MLRLKEGTGQPVHVLDTSFGGGKTHSLVLLYHIFKNKDLGTKYISNYNFKKQYNIDKVPDASLACIDCRRITKKTLWWEIANSLGKYDAFKKFDDSKIPPDNIGDIKALFEEPILLMIDELPHLFGPCSPLQLVIARPVDARQRVTNAGGIRFDDMPAMEQAHDGAGRQE